MGKNKGKGSNAQIGDEPFDDRMIIRCWTTDKVKWDEVAKQNDGSTSAWLRRLANEAVRRHDENK